MRKCSRMNWVKDERGVALIEFILVLPLFIIMVFCATEIGRYMLIQLKGQTASYAVANIVTQYAAATTAAGNGSSINLDKYANSLENAVGGQTLTKLMKPYSDAGSPEKQVMIITSLRNEPVPAPGTGTEKRVKWQVQLGGNLTGMKSQVTGNTVPSPAAFVRDQPTNFSTTALANMLEGENLIVVEVFYKYTPLTRFMIGDFDSFSFLDEKTLYFITVMPPRGEDLACLPDSTNSFLYTSDCP